LPTRNPAGMSARKKEEVHTPLTGEKKKEGAGLLSRSRKKRKNGGGVKEKEGEKG